MGKVSAGLLMYRILNGQLDLKGRVVVNGRPDLNRQRDLNERLEVLVVHPGGPFWVKKDRAAWFIPKGEVHSGENELAAAMREFEEETGLKPTGEFLPLGSIKQKSGKQVLAWAFRGDWDPSLLHSNTFRLEWPPHSGKFAEYPEVDRAKFFTIEAAREMMHPAEFEFIARLLKILEGSQPSYLHPGSSRPEK